MPYEIPQQLQYEEKIIFGLTFKQLLYAAIFIIPALAIFLRTKLDIFLKIGIGIILVGIASLFMFFNFASYMKDMLSWLQFREVKLMDPKMIQFLGIKKIDKEVVYVSKTKKAFTNKFIPGK